MSLSIDRRRFLAASGALLAASACRAPEGETECELLLVGATVVDGSGGAPFVADVGLRAGRIHFIGTGNPRRARRVLDVSGLVLAPGFVDIHTHSDRTIFEWPLAQSRIRQGCTTEITGNCGGSAAPHAEDGGRWSDVESYRSAWNTYGAALNHALLIGQGTLRRGVLGEVDRPATAEERAEIVRRFERALDQGAWGLSTGLEYVPGIYTPQDEVLDLVRVAGARGALYATHMRSEEAKLLDALEEALGTARAGNARLQVSHLKAAGRNNWKLQEQAVARIERARAEGLDVAIDVYPYTAYSTTLTILLEPWAREGGDEALLARLRDPAQRERIVREVGPRVEIDPGGFELIVISSVGDPAAQDCVGKSLDELARAWSVAPGEAFARLLELGRTDVGYVGHGMSEENVERLLAHPLVMIGSDGRSMAPTGSAANDRPHPRSYGTFPRVLGHYVRERKALDLPTAIAKMTSIPAARAGLTDRGRIERELAADLVLFDAARVADTATFEDPQRYPIGIEHVFVNGVAVVERGEPTGARPGRLLRR
ncbi:MAG: D-aminoacylase [Planctomycetota bacterium]|nr:D-aminoacylase [Planctomycetota bacterium]